MDNDLNDNFKIFMKKQIEAKVESETEFNAVKEFDLLSYIKGLTDFETFEGISNSLREIWTWPSPSP